MPNPVLNEKTFQPPDPRTQAMAAEAATVWNPPINDGPVTSYTSERMSIGGTVTATGVLFALILITGAVGWSLVTTDATTGTVRFPAWLLLPMLAAVGCAFWAMFKPKMARVAAPLYALLEGLVLGAISRVYEAQWDGIVVQAIGATLGVFAVVLAMYALRIVKVTNRFRSVVMAATLGLMLFYGVSLLFSLFGATPPFISSTSIWGIGFSVLAAGLAAFNLFLDFDMIEKGVQAGAPKTYEWIGALGLVVTLVWLYLELLRLLGKLRS
jgi:uncharacterized YccA/Bax inhibitor family protein